ncbi:MAG TPA: hypothetical protein DD725_08250 [Deltaproteobacteria bacterium]|nr:hypothetical protein [Deltaproteobacteria bacterium]
MEILLSSRQVADILGIDILVLYQWTHKNSIPHIKISKRMIRFKESELNEWLQQKHGEIQGGKDSAPVYQRRKKRAKNGSVGDEQISRVVDSAKKEVLCQ